MPQVEHVFYSKSFQNKSPDKKRRFKDTRRQEIMPIYAQVTKTMVCAGTWIDKEGQEKQGDETNECNLKEWESK